MKYEAPDFIKVTANIKESFADSGHYCTQSRGFLQADGEKFGSSNYYCGGDEKWLETEYRMNCGIANV